jgi:hypothetical protein
MTLYIYTDETLTFYKYGRILVSEAHDGELRVTDWTESDERIKVTDFAPSDWIRV